jgi:hypothetical protein
MYTSHFFLLFLEGADAQLVLFSHSIPVPEPILGTAAPVGNKIKIMGLV